MASLRQQASRSVVLHPIFFGLFPIFSLLSANLIWVDLHEALLPTAAILVIAGVLWLVLWPLLPEPRRRGLVISLIWLPFYGYGTAVNAIRERLDFREMLGPALVVSLGLAALLVALALLYALRRSPWTFEVINTFLNRLAAIMLALALASCLLAVALRRAESEQVVVQRHAESDQAVAVPVRLGPEKLAALPNIYFIICDAYPRSDYLKAYFDYDDTPFLNQLRERGFYVAERSRSNYCHTLLSLASTLNMDFLGPNILDSENSKENYLQLISLLRGNLVVRTLKAHGYEYVAIPSGMFPTIMVDADRFIHRGTINSTEYTQHLIDTAPLFSTRSSAFDITEYQQRLIDMTPVRSVVNRMPHLLWYQLVPFSLDKLASLRSKGRPMFVFAHLLAPHKPHAYDKDGKFVETFPPYKDGWRTVTEYLNTRLIEVVDEIQASEPNSIIIIQGDHGSNSAVHGSDSNWRGDWIDYVQSRSANLSTVYLPGKNDEGLLYPELTPVNLFRIIFDTYLETEYGRLEDATYLSPPNSHELIRVTEVY